jgi:pSer/pThr/pTyr-binding forkhead associated (FHA) protein
MRTLTFQVLEGIDKGRIFRDLPLPVTIGREEGNVLRLNDERVSRFHAKVQQDNGDIILTDLESTNGTRVNGNPVQIRRLRPGDQIGLGRSMLMFGSMEEIAARRSALKTAGQAGVPQAKTVAGDASEDMDFDLNIAGDVLPASNDTTWVPTERDLPPLPQKLSPAQAARLAEILDFLHRGLSSALDKIHAPDDANHVTLPYPEWQKIQAVQMFLARYLRAVAEPDLMGE